MEWGTRMELTRTDTSDKDRYFPQALEKKGLQEINLESALMKPEERDDARGGRTLPHLQRGTWGSQVRFT